MQPKPTRDHILTPEQLRQMRTADRKWERQRDERRSNSVNEPAEGVSSEEPQDRRRH